MNTRQKLTLGIAAIFMVTLTIVGVTYAYFVTRVTGENNTESIDVQTATVGDIVYKDINGPVQFKNVLPGTTEYYQFSVANLGEQQQPFALFLTGTPGTGSFETTETIGGVETPVTYTYGEFIHTVNGSNADTGVTTAVTGCYGQYAKMSAQLTDGDATYRSLCFSDAETSKYNNIRISLYELGTTTPTSISGDSGNKTFELASNVFADFTAATLNTATPVTIANDQIMYDGETGLVARIDIAGGIVRNYVLKVEYLKATVTSGEPATTTDLIQNAENLAALNIKVDIKA